MKYRNPTPTVDVIVHRVNPSTTLREVLLIERANPPHGWALPGGFVDEGELVERAAIREVEEETGLSIDLDGLFYVYSNPKRDARQHNLSIVFHKCIDFEQSEGAQGNDDASDARFFALHDLPEMAFDHAEIVQDFIHFLHDGSYPNPMHKLEQA